jgi:triphosphatase
VVKANAVSLEMSMKAEDALRLIGEDCLAQLQGNREMVLHGDDIEGVHQMRIALRRLRSALGVFSKVIDKQQAAGLGEELNWIAELLGKARDLDVFLTETLPPILKQLDQHPGLLALRNKATAAQGKAYNEARKAIRSLRYQHLLLRVGALLKNLHVSQQSIPVGELAANMLQRRYKQLREHGKQLHRMDAGERHLARIASKKLRYTAEFFASLYPLDKTVPFIKGLCGLQNVLGALNDVAITESLLHELAGDHANKALDEAQYILFGWCGHRTRKKLDHMQRAWKVFAVEKPYW